MTSLFFPLLLCFHFYPQPSSSAHLGRFFCPSQKSPILSASSPGKLIDKSASSRPVVFTLQHIGAIGRASSIAEHQIHPNHYIYLLYHAIQYIMQPIQLNKKQAYLNTGMNRNRNTFPRLPSCYFCSLLLQFCELSVF